MSAQNPPSEYVQLLTAVIKCLTGGRERIPATVEDLAAWMHGITKQEVENALSGDASSMALKRLVKCLIENTHDRRLCDWTAEQIAFWCQNTRPEYFQAALANIVAPPDRL